MVGNCSNMRKFVFHKVLKLTAIRLFPYLPCWWGHIPSICRILFGFFALRAVGELSQLIQNLHFYLISSLIFTKCCSLSYKSEILIYFHFLCNSHECGCLNLFWIWVRFILDAAVCWWTHSVSRTSSSLGILIGSALTYLWRRREHFKTWVLSPFPQLCTSCATIRQSVVAMMWVIF